MMDNNFVEVFVDNTYKPRGHRNRIWYFCKVDPQQQSDWANHCLSAYHGTFIQAKRWAVTYCREHGISKIFVCN
jgi:hypothetical protein